MELEEALALGDKINENIRQLGDIEIGIEKLFSSFPFHKSEARTPLKLLWEAESHLRQVFQVVDRACQELEEEEEGDDND